MTDNQRYSQRIKYNYNIWIVIASKYFEMEDKEVKI